MTDKNIINAFAIKYYKPYSDSQTGKQEISTGFAEECFALSFEMDCGRQFIEAYGKEAFYYKAGLDKVKSNINDINILGSAIFSKWRYITHWAQSSLLEADNREWFITAFDRLAAITQ